MEIEQSTSDAALSGGVRNGIGNFQRGRINSAPSSRCNQAPIERLGLKIHELSEYIKDRNNVHGVIKKLVRTIDTAYHLALKDFIAASKTASSKTVQATQTSPSTTFPTSVPKTPDHTSKESNPKKRPLSTPSPTSGLDLQLSKKQAQGTWAEVTRRGKKKKVLQNPGVTTKEAQKPQDRDGPKNSHRKTKRRRQRTKAVLVQPAEGRTYADLLKEIKAKVNPTETGVDIKSIKQTRQGGVLLEMSPKSEDSAAFAAAIKTATENIGTVKTLTPLTTIEILDLDGVSTENDVREALKRDSTINMEIKRINLTKVTARGQRAAFCEIDEASAIKALDKARIKIGWVNCRIRPVVKVIRCFRCLGFGHQANKCAGPDRSQCCYKCGGKNHKSADCIEEPKCYLCALDKEDKNSVGHITGSKECKAFRTALAEATKEQK
ncbi:uncharacterized protein LOC124373122 [Homalodisca vitripennis]|uniref:uncharacterized protein LOC124373122 n=1 Tax=Homalodisca vitripennis TaxID=197043 RepID=UPI001EEB5C75|nr:uncharacterized protein LOC124373122 [Homalodisca vitripennis]